jgi:glycosyltransferase involved in cell wall biosynthesis
MRIAQVAPLWMTVPPSAYGGTELIIHLLTEELVRRGHHVTLFAPGDSRTAAKLRAVVPDGIDDAMRRGDAIEYGPYANHALAAAVQASEEFEVIHSHLGFATIPIGLGSTARILHTLHAPPSADDLWMLRKYPNADVSAISRYQASAIDQIVTGNVPVVHHGLDFSAYRFSAAPGSYLAFLGRMGPQKSPADAIRVARAAGLPIVLAGQPQNPAEETYFKTSVEPLIDGATVRYLGPVGHDAKVELLRNAAALIFPIQGDEAFGLAMIEAMACGTPVVACDRASVSEIIEPGITGFYAHSVGDLPKLVTDALALDRAAVRRCAQECFSVESMVSGYVDIYESLADGAAQ